MYVTKIKKKKGKIQLVKSEKVQLAKKSEFRPLLSVSFIVLLAAVMSAVNAYYM